MKRITGSVDPQAASLTMDWSPLDVDVLWCARHRNVSSACSSPTFSFGAVIFELAAGHIMASPAMHESHLPAWTSPHIRIMLGSIFNAQGAAGTISLLLFFTGVGRPFHCSFVWAASFCVLDTAFAAPDMPTIDELLALPFFAVTTEQSSLEGSR